MNLRRTLLSLPFALTASSVALGHELPGGRLHVHSSWLESVPAPVWAAASLLAFATLFFSRRTPAPSKVVERRSRSA